MIGSITAAKAAMAAAILVVGAEALLEDIPPTLLNSLGVVGLWSFIGFLILTDRLVWHKRLAEAKAERDQWRDLALRGLGVAEKTTAYAEVATGLIAHNAEDGTT